MSETPLQPTPVRDVFLRQGRVLAGRGKLGFLAAAAVLLGAVFTILYFTVFPIPKPVTHSAQAGPALDSHAVSVATTFTKLGLNEHHCRAAGRYTLGPGCPSKLLPAGTRVSLNTWLIQRSCGSARARPYSPLAGRSVSPGCIQFVTNNGHTISETMAKMARGWRVVAVRARRTTS